MPTAVSPISTSLLRYRAVKTTDADQLKAIHDDLFPVKYNEQFYENACSNKGIGGLPLYCIVVTSMTTSLVAESQQNAPFAEEVIVGFILAQFLDASHCGDDDLFNSLLYAMPKKVFYILTIGVVSGYRELKIGSNLLRMASEHAQTERECGCIYLHVIDYNHSAMRFYQANSFLPLKKCEDFYIINALPYNSHLYIRYLNGYKHPLWYSPQLSLPRSAVVDVDPSCSNSSTSGNSLCSGDDDSTAAVSSNSSNPLRKPSSSTSSTSTAVRLPVPSANIDDIRSATNRLVGVAVDPFDVSYFTLFVNVMGNLMNYFNGSTTTTATTTTTAGVAGRVCGSRVAVTDR